MTQQEMFDRAVRGLRAQRFRQASVLVKDVAADEDGDPVTRCVYLAPDGTRCAWGHVDPTLGPDDEGSVFGLRQAGRGVAATLSEADLKFATELQHCHDESESASDMEQQLRDLGELNGLAWPAEETK